MWNLHRIYATNHYTAKHSQFQAFLFWFEIAPNQQSKEPESPIFPTTLQPDENE